MAIAPSTLAVKLHLSVGDNTPTEIGVVELPLTFQMDRDATVHVLSSLAGARAEIAALLRAAADEIEHPTEGDDE